MLFWLGCISAVVYAKLDICWSQGKPHDGWNQLKSAARYGMRKKPNFTVLVSVVQNLLRAFLNNWFNNF